VLAPPAKVGTEGPADENRNPSPVYLRKLTLADIVRSCQNGLQR